MAALLGLPQGDVMARVLLGRQGLGGHEGVVARIERERGHADAVKHRLGRGTRPVVGRVLEAVQGRGEKVVELVEVARGQQLLPVEQARVLLQLAERLGHHGAHEHAGVDHAVEAAPDGVAARGQVQRGTHRCNGAHAGGRFRAHLTGPAHQRIATQRHAHGDQRPARVFLGKTAQDPVDLLEVTRVVGAWRVVEFARASPEVGHRVGHAVGGGEIGEGHGVLARGRTLQPVEQHQQGRLLRAAVQGLVHVDEVAIGRLPSAALPARRRSEMAAAGQRGPHRLRVASGQPPRRAVGKAVGLQCSTGWVVKASSGSVREPGLAWCATMRQPWAVLA